MIRIRCKTSEPVSVLASGCNETAIEVKDRTLEDRAAANKKRALRMAVGFGVSVFVVVSLILFLLGAGITGLVIGLITAGIWVGVAQKRSTAVVLDLCDAEAADPDAQPRLFNVTAGLCMAMGVEAPELYIIDDPALNALAAGCDPRSSVLVVTNGLLDTLSVVELEAIIALGLYRIKTQEVAPRTLAVPTIGATGVLSEAADGVPVLQRLLGIPAPLIQRYLARLHLRSEELEADIDSMRFTRFPPALASALQKMEGRTAVALAAPVTSHLWIAPPVSVAAHPAVNQIHVPLDERIAVLQEL